LKDIIILGGPNGAGKTTAAQVLVPEGLGIREFVNADEIARGLSPFNVDRAAIPAARLMIERMRDLVRAEESFAFETTCAGRQHAIWLRECEAAGWRIALLYLWLPSVAAALERVARRVREGGHDVPPDIVARRYAAGVRNLRRLYLPLAYSAAIYDNSDERRTLIATRSDGRPLVIHDAVRWATIEKAGE
jgi:predicted ABC-type ATPase